MGNKTSKTWVRHHDFFRTNSSEQILGYYNIELIRSMNGIDDPLYKQKINNGVSATNNMVATEELLDWRPGVFTTRGADGTLMQSNVFASYNLVPIKAPNFWKDSLINDATNDAAIGIRKKIANDRQKFSGQVAVIELRKTLQQLRHPFREAQIGLKNLFNKATQKPKGGKKLPGLNQRVYKPKTTSDIVASSWLEYTMGIAPFVADLEGVLQAYMQASQGEIRRLSYKGVKEEVTTVNFSGTNFGLWSSYGRQTSSKVEVIFTVGNKTIIASNNAADRILQFGGFDRFNIVPTAWELLPWSFMVDYFTNIGDIFSTALMSLDTVAWSQKTVRQINASRYVDLHYAAMNGRELVEFVTPSMFSSSKVVSRSAAAIPFPEFRFELPGKPVQLLNMLALLKRF